MTVLADRNEAAASSNQRRIVQRRTLPSGRAITGGVLIGASAVLVFGAWLSAARPHLQPAVIASHQLSPGTPLTASDLSITRAQLPSSLAKRSFEDPQSLIGRVVDAPLHAGDLIQTSALSPTGAPGLRPIAVPISTTDAATISLGEEVDLLVTQGQASSATTSTVVRGARILSYQGSSGSSIIQSGAGIATLGVKDLTEVQAIVNAQSVGVLHLVVATSSDGSGLGGSVAGPGVQTAPAPTTLPPTTAAPSAPANGTPAPGAPASGAPATPPPSAGTPTAGNQP